MYLVFIFTINFFFKNKKYLQSYNGSKHQSFVNISVPLTGGIYLIAPICIFFFDNFLFFSITIFILFLIGFISDTNILSSPKKRFLFQLILIFIFVFTNKLEVFPTRIEFIDENFQNTFLSYLFTIFCLMILINGSNFIDGLNGLLLGYCSIILFFLLKLNLFDSFIIPNDSIIYLLILMLFIFFLNLSNQLFLGDSGAYCISFFIGYTLISIYNLNIDISPYYIILLLWYPCFENLFSIIRKKISKNNPLKPDNKHFHQYLFIYLKQTFEINNANSNILSSLIINLYNFLIFYWASKNINLTIFQISLLLLNIFIYVFVYAFLKRSILKKKFYHR